MNKAFLLAQRQGLTVIRKVWFAFPEGSLKERIRKLGLTAFKRFPVELTLRKGETIVQVGATPGGELLRQAEIVGETGRVIAIEPERGNLEGLRKMLDEESIKNVTLVPKGAWREKGKQRLLLSPIFSGDHKIEVSGVLHDNDLRPENYQSFTEVEVDTVDNILRTLGISHVDYVKITINGAELEVLKGMEETLKGDLRLWVKGHALKDGQPLHQAIASFLKERGFSVQITKGEGAPISKDFIRKGDVYATRPRVKDLKGQVKV
jgi:FkbM family methyltransferase